ncbi:MAG: 1-deoxy-D-xylulose-5-phosphate synthase [Clostridia bacterium]|nr:1-deoxy-D-xylulose-5-phosphate synthase [Clostridia bacterium]
MKYLDKIKSPEDLKRLSSNSLTELAKEIREVLINTCSQNGGHLASNLGVVELSLALHLVFNSPEDSIIWDVGHQCYTHKLLTGRLDKFNTIRQENGLSGFTDPDESVHDKFAAGHSGTSIAQAVGLAIANKINGRNNYSIAVIGDASFTNGLAYEALNNSNLRNTNLIVILNDNEMSISPNVGSFARYLADLRTRPEYYKAKEKLATKMDEIPILGSAMHKTIVKLKQSLKNSLYQSNLFENMGFGYLGPIDGYDLNGLINALESAKTITGPVLIHINTVKGKGYSFAEKNPSKFHGVTKFNTKNGEFYTKDEVSFSDNFGKQIVKQGKKNLDLCVITAAMVSGTGVEQFSKEYPNRFFDVGIAEEFAVTFSSGLSEGGKVPVFVVYSTFLQRCYDQLIHDIAMQNQKLVLCVDRAGFVPGDGQSHQGIFDVGFLSTIPKTEIYSPSYLEEQDLYLDKLINDGEKKISVIRYPKGTEGYKPKNYIPIFEDVSVFGDKKSKIAIISYGRVFSESVKALEELEKKSISVELIKLNKIFPISKNLIEILKDKERIYFFEEAAGSGCISEKLGNFLLKNNFKGKYYTFNPKNEFIKQAEVKNLFDRYKLSAKKQVEEILKNEK